MIRVRLVETALPAGSRDPHVLISWILDSLGLVRSRGDSKSAAERLGGINKILSQCFIADPKSGWTAAEISDVTGISSTGVHHQLVKLSDSGLLSSRSIGGKRTYMINGGSFSNAAEFIGINSVVIARQRLKILAGSVSNSSERMLVQGEQENVPFRIDIVGLTPKLIDDELLQLSIDLGFSGDRIRLGDNLHVDLLRVLAKSNKPLGITELMEETGGSRARVGRILDRMRSAGLLERAVVDSRLDVDIFGGLLRQYRTRGSDWLVGRGGLSRLPKEVRESLIDNLEKGSHTLEKTSDSIGCLSVDEKRVMLNMLGGRVPLGYRVKGSTGGDVIRSILIGLERVTSRITTICDRLDDVISKLG